MECARYLWVSMLQSLGPGPTHPVIRAGLACSPISEIGRGGERVLVWRVRLVGYDI